MATIERRSTATWNGDLAKGNGTFTVGSGAFSEQGVTWASRVERPNGRTSPEELIAAAQATCFAMALSHTLATDGHPADSVQVTAVCGAEFGEGLKINTMDIYVTGNVPGLDSSGFEEEVRKAEQGCPVANLLRNGLTINLHIGETDPRSSGAAQSAGAGTQSQ